MKRIFGTFFIVFFLILILFIPFFATGYYSFFFINKAEWKSTNAKIIEPVLNYQPSGYSFPQVSPKYEYWVDSVRYKGIYYSTFPIQFAPDEPMRILSYKKGDIIDVFYNSKNPQESLIRIDFFWGNMSFTIIYFFAYFFLVLLFSAILINTKSKMISKILLWAIFGSIPIVIPFFISTLIITQCILGFTTKDWIKVDGKILYSGCYAMSLSSRGNSAYNIYPVVKFAYCVDDTSYIGTCASYGFFDRIGGLNSESSVHNFLKQYPSGQNISVFYCPSNPARSVILRGFPVGSSVWVTLVITSLLYVGSIFFILRKILLSVFAKRC